MWFSLIHSALQLIFIENYCLSSNVLGIKGENVQQEREGFHCNSRLLRWVYSLCVCALIYKVYIKEEEKNKNKVSYLAGKKKHENYQFLSSYLKNP